MRTIIAKMETSKNFVITGISSGLGLALTRTLLQSGHQVQGCGRRPNPIPSAEAEQHGERYGYQQLDILDFEAVRDWVSAIQKQGPPIDFLIHNAAVIHENARLWEIDREQLNAVLQVNVMGTFNVLQAFLPGMLKEKRGMIITLSSGAGRMGISRISGYCASKWAVEGLTKSLADELPEGMAAFPISPGMVDTDMLRTNFGEEAAHCQKAEEWAEAAMPFILNLDASQNGESLTTPDTRP
ncbi:MAG: SDR family oxidoreductase [Opitutales bacterium]|nr:SDR family oxidoreductase [Opitutales bacterium]